MKTTLLTLLLIFSIQISFGQSCGAYRIKYIGQVLDENMEVLRVKLPTIPFLHGLIEDSVAYAYLESPLIDHNIEFEISSHMTCHLFEKGSVYKDLYSGVRPTIPLIFVVLTEEGEQEISHKIPWEDIKISRIIDTGFGNLFEVNLGSISIEPGSLKN